MFASLFITCHCVSPKLLYIACSIEKISVQAPALFWGLLFFVKKIVAEMKIIRLLLSILFTFCYVHLFLFVLFVHSIFTSQYKTLNHGMDSLECETTWPQVGFDYRHLFVYVAKKIIVINISQFCQPLNGSNAVNADTAVVRSCSVNEWVGEGKRYPLGEVLVG